jgi:hypothetical protein
MKRCMTGRTVDHCAGAIQDQGLAWPSSLR